MKKFIENYHTHTFRCNHASGTEKEYIEKAISEGLNVMGFADHVPYKQMKGKYSGFRMKPEQIHDYVETISSLKEEYSGKIKILLGYEAEYYPDIFAEMCDFVGEHGYDYLILGQHFVGDSEETIYSGVRHTDEIILGNYVDQVLEGMSTGKYLYLAHPDVINFVGDEAIYIKHMERLCKSMKEMDYPLEINMLGIDDERFYPKELFFSIAGEVGNKIVIGCDAHRPGLVGDQTVVNKAMEIIDKFSLDFIDRLLI
ncbi:MAG: histidinol-phosphatase HisJ family protein [Ruminococcaceae bacterium]|nr:histidinol-phosphatase HisJ family protein [Oscillospiraceae bacterium]